MLERPTFATPAEAALSVASDLLVLAEGEWGHRHTVESPDRAYAVVLLEVGGAPSVQRELFSGVCKRSAGGWDYVGGGTGQAGWTCTDRTSKRLARHSRGVLRVVGHAADGARLVAARCRRNTLTVPVVNGCYIGAFWSESVGGLNDWEVTTPPVGPT